MLLFLASAEMGDSLFDVGASVEMGESAIPRRFF